MDQLTQFIWWLCGKDVEFPFFQSDQSKIEMPMIPCDVKGCMDNASAKTRIPNYSAVEFLCDKHAREFGYQDTI